MEDDKELEAKVRVAGYKAKIEWVVAIAVVGYDWNCSQHITPRWTREEIEAVMGGRGKLVRGESGDHSRGGGF
jgi:hypothetical protein